MSGRSQRAARPPHAQAGQASGAGQTVAGHRPEPSRLLVFLKAPRPGFVKTRLAATLGTDLALAAYRALAERTLRQVAGIDRVTLCVTPDDAEPEIAPWVRPAWSVLPQGAGDLGQRLARAFVAAFAGGATRVAAIGTDCPELTAADVDAAWQALSKVDVVLGPACDGGYWLIALRQPQPAIFQGIDWGTERVLSQTLDTARQAGLSVDLLRELSDVDDEADWHAYRARHAPGT